VIKNGQIALRLYIMFDLEATFDDLRIRENRLASVAVFRGGAQCNEMSMGRSTLTHVARDIWNSITEAIKIRNHK